MSAPRPHHGPRFHFTEELSTLWELCCHLDFAGRKALVTLARSQSLPDPNDSVLFAKILPILPYISVPGSIDDNGAYTLSAEGKVVTDLIVNPLFSAMVISFALGVELDDNQVLHGRKTSLAKELLATQTLRRPSSWNWSAILRGDGHQIIHPLFPNLSPPQLRFSIALSRFRNRCKNRTVFPHYTRRGVSHETAERFRIQKENRYLKFAGPRRTLFNTYKVGNVTSLDIVKHHVRCNEWIAGRSEMKQKWYPSGLLPRTYFCWGGEEISASTYLRTFFNDLVDQFPPTQRNNRVHPNWLFDPDISDGGGFMFYDLTSFTSWFHEHVPFLKALQDYFSGICVYLLGYDLRLKRADLGVMIGSYTRICNDFPEFVLSEKLTDIGVAGVTVYRHLCAGLLGVPGNLATCTLPHGLALSANYSEERCIQAAGDDAGASYRNDHDQYCVLLIGNTLGVLQWEKIFFDIQECCLFLKRRVINNGTSIDLAQLLIYPLLPYLLSRNDHVRSNRFSLPHTADVLKRACSVLVTFHRDLWKHSKGDLSDQDCRIILSFLRTVHDVTQIPYGGIFQGRLCEDDKEQADYPDVRLKFPVDDVDILLNRPDLLFAGKYIEHFRIRDTSGVELSEIGSSLQEGDVIVVNAGKKWTFLEDMGYARVLGIPGEVIHLVGADAKEAFLHGSEPSVRRVEILSCLNEEQMIAMGLYDPEFFDSSSESYSLGMEVSSVYRRSAYVDYDKPVSNYVGPENDPFYDLEEGEIFDSWDDETLPYF